MHLIEVDVAERRFLTSVLSQLSWQPSLAVAEPAEDNRANTATTAKFMLGFVMCRAKAEKVN
jgi:hypothetical protein